MLTALQMRRLDRLAGRLMALPDHRREAGIREIEAMDEKDALRNAQVFTVGQAAQLCEVVPETVRRWIRRDQLQAARVGRDYRISRPELARFWRSIGGGELFDDTTEG